MGCRNAVLFVFAALCCHAAQSAAETSQPSLCKEWQALADVSSYDFTVPDSDKKESGTVSRTGAAEARAVATTGEAHSVSWEPEDGGCTVTVAGHKARINGVRTDTGFSGGGILTVSDETTCLLHVSYTASAAVTQVTASCGNRPVGAPPLALTLRHTVTAELPPGPLAGLHPSLASVQLAELLPPMLVILVLRYLLLKATA